MRLQRLRVAIVAVAVLLVGCDHATKHVAKRELERGGPRGVVSGLLDLHYTENRDSGFGLLRSVPERIRTPALTVVQLVSGAVFLLLGLRKHGGRKLRLALVLVSAGALGNGLDRLVRGYVVDFLRLPHWPVFNVADIYITVGAILLMLAMRRQADRRTPAPASPG